MRMILRIAVLGGLVYAGKWIYDNFVRSAIAGREPAGPSRIGYDTPTGTDPAAKYDRPGYEDKSFGQAVNQDMETADRLLDETGGDVDEAAIRFRSVSAGAPALKRQEPDDS
jgi:hypothetical protein